eukprot:TRINITY_DN1815_c0_g2_i3.p1 TRINITY_DN1815_c0_g2~~TRINITY_DN1815_c0_g2_i3.p1  ORF type:complete len:142 (+),score=0.95 TRINITY_DN1815_c0_g2_i3:156-581(+)
MHGVKRRVKSSQEVETERKNAELEKIQKFRSLQAAFMQKRAAQALDQEVLDITASLLDMNPEFYTLWYALRRNHCKPAWHQPRASHCAHCIMHAMRCRSSVCVWSKEQLVLMADPRVLVLLMAGYARNYRRQVFQHWHAVR